MEDSEVNDDSGLMNKEFVSLGMDLLGFKCPVVPNISQSSPAIAWSRDCFRIIKMYISDSGNPKFETIDDIPPKAHSLPKLIAPEGKKIREFQYFKRSLFFLIDLLKFLDSKAGGVLLLHLNKVNLGHFFAFPSGDQLDLKKGLYCVLTMANSKPSNSERTIIGNDIYLLEFLNLTKLLNEFKFNHLRNNFFKVTSLTMSTFQSAFKSRSEAYKAIKDTLGKMKKKAQEYEENFERLISNPAKFYFEDFNQMHNHFTPEGQSSHRTAECNEKCGVPIINIFRNEKISDGNYSSSGKIYAIAKYNRKHLLAGGSKEIIDIIKPGSKGKTIWGEGSF